MNSSPQRKEITCQACGVEAPIEAVQFQWVVKEDAILPIPFCGAPACLASIRLNWRLNGWKLHNLQ